MTNEAQLERQWFDDFLFFRRYGIMPRGGGMHDQDPRWLQAVQLIELELSARDGKDSGKSTGDHNLGCR
jgi:hypothetical protein